MKDGWNYTGDAFLLDEAGYFVFQARTDDMIVSAGYNIAGPEVEGALLLHPAVAECGVVGATDEQRGQIVKAYVVLEAGYTADEATTRALQDFVKQTIAPYKYPRAIEYVPSLPRTETGKLHRRVTGYQAFRQRSHGYGELDGGAGFRARREGQLLVDHGKDATVRGVDHHVGSLDPVEAGCRCSRVDRGGRAAGGSFRAGTGRLDRRRHGDGERRREPCRFLYSWPWCLRWKC